MAGAPSFWFRGPGWQSFALSPLAVVYGATAARRMRAAPRRPVGLPVLCVGNLTVGGNGKTPVVIALARAARSAGLRPGILSRGHGGNVRAVRLVDAEEDHAADVGDEPLLLSRDAPVAVGADRAEGARLLKQQGCDFLLMDDGFQSARIGFDLGLLVVDRRFGLGNGLCLPAGPLRAPIGVQLEGRPDLLLMGEGDAADALVGRATRQRLVVHTARLVPENSASLNGRRVLAFAGIGHPGKFFATLAVAGAEVVQTRAFPDHHPFRAAEIEGLARQAGAAGLALATTAKDFARLRDTLGRDLLEKILVLEVAVRWDRTDNARQLIDRTLETFAGKRLRA